ncbi:MAG TPA: HPr(Ser) kinase/phosphatase [Halanaerobiales bacterium]|nr:HPr(Ser) kinase/phosphatase [Halanaerobiales bacterium]HPZ61928.1 HPr(Ser) kinase/phosphatase [Halanaerobiales bacterium]HQD03349.1 HPr(Ser) kinase/phosphatase [Halanaerobiales bacterium]
MVKKSKIAVQEIIEEFDLALLAGNPENRYITISDIKRPGIELAGFWEFFTPDRVQLLGMTEISFLKELDSVRLVKSIEKLLSYDLPCVIIARGLDVPDILIEEADRNGIPLLRTDISTTRFLSLLTNYLEESLAPTETVHGVLVDIYGVGVLITGKSGIGKSETAVQLVKRGHRLVADDLIIVKKIGERQLVGTAPEVSRHFLEIRGIGIINIRALFGASAVIEKVDINMIAKLEYWNEEKSYERLGFDNLYGELMGIEIPQVIIPVKPGRDLAMVLEIAAMNYRMNLMGYNAARDFSRKVTELLRSSK